MSLDGIEPLTAREAEELRIKVAAQDVERTLIVRHLDRLRAETTDPVRKAAFRFAAAEIKAGKHVA